jgi:mannose-1-phosphate guanylyltransferase
MVAPSDHLILKREEFRQSIVKAFDFIDTHDALLTLGIKPNRPETGYGYIQVGNKVDDNILEVKTFTEKPNEDPLPRSLWIRASSSGTQACSSGVPTP